MRTVGELGETGLIERVRRLCPTSPSVVEGIGDDCAVLRSFDHLIAVSCDMFVENVHFRRGRGEPRQIGLKAAAAALSDLAAMGATPQFMLVAFSCPGDTPVAYVEELYQGIANITSRHGVAIVGGDMTTGPCIAMDVTVMGAIRGQRYLRRADALAGDALAVTGALGVSAAGLHAMENNHEAPGLIQAHFEPKPRIPEGHWLCHCPDVHAMIDVSDGLFQDSSHLGRDSQLGINICSDALSVDPRLESYCKAQGLDAAQLMLAGGEDYELAFAVAGDAAEKTVTAFHQEFRTPLHIVGEFTEAWQGVRLDGEELKGLGFHHFGTGDRTPNS
jgi:thiamine-monophosphate kinase